MGARLRWRRTIARRSYLALKGGCLRLYTEGSSVYQGTFFVTDKGKPAIGRKSRADAERNRINLLETAKSVFAEKGSGASLEEIARAAEVGIGTLYRHFPTRDALIEAVYHNESEQLIAAATRLADKHPPAKALREWLLLFVDYMETKHGMSEALNSLVSGTSDLYAASGAQLKKAIAMLVDNAVASGDIRLAIEPLDLLRALAGVATIASGPNGTRAAKRLVDILLGGISTRSQ